MSLASLLLYKGPMDRRFLALFCGILLTGVVALYGCGGASTVSTGNEGAQITPTLEFPVDDGGNNFQAAAIIAATCLQQPTAEDPHQISPQCAQACDLLAGFSDWFVDDASGTAAEKFADFKSTFMQTIDSLTEKDPLVAFDSFIGMCVALLHP